MEKQTQTETQTQNDLDSIAVMLLRGLLDENYSISSGGYSHDKMIEFIGKSKLIIMNVLEIIQYRDMFGKLGGEDDEN